MLPHSWLLKRCECLRGYEGDGLNCAPGPNADCLILRNCHQVILIVTCVVNDGSTSVECFNERETIFITTSWQPTNLIVGRRMCSGKPWARSLLQMREWISRSITLDNVGFFKRCPWMQEMEPFVRRRNRLGATCWTTATGQSWNWSIQPSMIMRQNT